MKVNVDSLAVQLSESYERAVGLEEEFASVESNLTEIAFRLGQGSLQGSAYLALSARLSTYDVGLVRALRGFLSHIASCYECHLALLQRFLPEGGIISTVDIETSISNLQGVMYGLDARDQIPSKVDIGTGLGAERQYGLVPPARYLTSNTRFWHRCSYRWIWKTRPASCRGLRSAAAKRSLASTA